MASLFKRNGKGPWRIAYIDWDPKTGRKRRRQTSTRQGDKAVATQMAERLEADARRHKQEADDLAELRRRGLSDPVAERLADHGRVTLSDHLDAYEAVLEGKGNTADHIRTTLSACRSILDACGFVFPGDLHPVKVSRWVTRERKGTEGREAPAARTINRKLGAFKGFSHWLWETGRIRTDPMVQVHKLNAQSDRRIRGRALTDDEIVRLLDAAENGPEVMGVSGPGRAMLYRIALGTGHWAGAHGKGQKPCRLLAFWRRGRDLNPRVRKYPTTGLAIQRFRPLSHLSNVQRARQRRMPGCLRRSYTPVP